MRLSALHARLQPLAGGDLSQCPPGSGAGRPGLEPAADLDPELDGVCFDSRRVTPGTLFCALPGKQDDGLAFLPQALAAGATAVLCPAVDSALPCPSLQVASGSRLRLLAATAAHALHGDPGASLWTAAVTGTNGKSTVVHLLRTALSLAGGPTAASGTLGFQLDAAAPAMPLPPGGLTTPEADQLAAWLAVAVATNHRAAVMEASSHGIYFDRLASLPLDAVAWTNLSQDHLDFHQDLEHYAAAKAKLFHAQPSATPAFYPAGVAAIEAALSGMAATPVAWQLWPSARADRPDWHPSASLRGVATLRPEGLQLEVDGFYGCATLRSPLVGMHNAENLLVAFGLASAAGMPREEVVHALAQVTAPRGRLERVAGPEGCQLFVDYAHTPDALRHVLEALRQQYPHARLGVVFGAGGNRDARKRPLMGAAVAAIADWSVLTSDNPRHEAPEVIAAMVASGMEACPPSEILLDRRTAIREAVARLAPGDVLLVAGKGHEDYQEIAGLRRPFDDRSELEQAVACFL